MDESSEPSEQDIEAAIEASDGDAREAVRALLRDVADLAGVLADVLATSVSRGFVRGRVLPGAARRPRSPLSGDDG